MDNREQQIQSLVADESTSMWLLYNSAKTEDNKPYDLREHLFWVDILEDWSPKQVWFKSAQVGGTLAANYKIIKAVHKFRINAIYTMPSASDVETLVKGKWNRLLKNNDFLKKIVSGDTIGEKTIGDNIIYFRGAFTEVQAISIPSDLNVHDEVDRSDQDVIDTYASRLDHSDYAWQWMFSNPSVPGNGVSKYWEDSTQAEWFITCATCKKEQYLRWPENVCMERQVFQCSHCKAELSNEERRVGRWRKRKLNAEWSGYHISQLMSLRKTAKDIIEAYETKNLEYFYNFVLGLPYVGEGNKLAYDSFMNNVQEFDAPLTNLVIGCDSGKKRHWVIGNEYGLLGYGIANDIYEVGSLLDKYKDAILVIDNLPDLTGPELLAEKYPNRVYRAVFSADRHSMELVRWGENENDGQVLIDRNRMIQFIVDEFTMKRINVQGNKKDWEKYFAHWDVMHRITGVDARGNGKITWKSSTVNDHWAFATVYWRTGMTRKSRGGLSVIGPKMGIVGQKSPYTVNDSKIDIKPKAIKRYDWRNS